MSGIVSPRSHLLMATEETFSISDSCSCVTPFMMRRRLMFSPIRISIAVTSFPFISTSHPHYNGYKGKWEDNKRSETLN